MYITEYLPRQKPHSKYKIRGYIDIFPQSTFHSFGFTSTPHQLSGYISMIF